MTVAFEHQRNKGAKHAPCHCGMSNEMSECFSHGLRTMHVRFRTPVMLELAAGRKNDNRYRVARRMHCFMFHSRGTDSVRGVPTHGRRTDQHLQRLRPTDKMYEILPHTADVRLRVTSPDLNSLFVDAARGLFSLIVSNMNDVVPRTRVEFHIEGQDLAYLLADWLSELLFTFESRRLLLSQFDVVVGSGGLEASGLGETFDEARHVLDHEIKAITYHRLRVEQVNCNWLAEVIVDI